MTRPALSIVVPVLDEAGQIEATLAALAPLRHRGVELIVVDGGSQDGTVALARAEADAVLDAPRGRARQMNAGAAAARGEVLLFLHADTILPAEADRHVLRAVAGGRDWGRFDVRIAGRHPMLRVVARLMNLRSRLTGIATGDQGMFVRRELFQRIGGFPDQPLMEDIELSRRLRRVCAPACLPARAITSGRRWESRGVWRTIFLMWRLRWRYWRGESAHRLAAAYR
ncbi:TIGR04283 family arsenosugar biosynthesis glycosyltransferase [Zeimonas arvi]|uniref:Glycosyltransferase n=1 Tax=Zeimonas arvi TaxID=2498847 RepID=A0A5C8P3Q6_9BURK|nr:TIGR04283 family arsenosugar biosynthesis glycosyltransferase [Zeimonas arvi]TXL68296.1 glycosyltransferase [Zeimonas arvi]